ncbi:MAG TPA: hypothetical protein VFJ14_06635 [Nocardioidaceae bacterium]|nr:hypothetical protein [Nocardioidaceae bacterium]
MAKNLTKDMFMAKALLGYVGGPDPRIFEEARQLRRRVQDLESQVLRMQREIDDLAAALHQDPLLTLVESEREPALT